MSLYFGFPVKAIEALRILNFDVQSTLYDICNKNNIKNDEYINNFYIQDVLKIHFKSKNVNMRLYTTDKSQCILGYKLTEIVENQDEFMKVDDFITILSDMKCLFTSELEILNANLITVTLCHMERDDVYVSFPKPVILSWN